MVDVYTSHGSDWLTWDHMWGKHCSNYCFAPNDEVMKKKRGVSFTCTAAGVSDGWTDERVWFLSEPRPVSPVLTFDRKIKRKNKSCRNGWLSGKRVIGSAASPPSISREDGSCASRVSPEEAGSSRSVSGGYKIHSVSVMCALHTPLQVK